jgi:hypothetical protein
MLLVRLLRQCLRPKEPMMRNTTHTDTLHPATAHLHFQPGVNTQTDCNRQRRSLKRKTCMEPVPHKVICRPIRLKEVLNHLLLRGPNMISLLQASPLHRHPVHHEDLLMLRDPAPSHAVQWSNRARVVNKVTSLMIWIWEEVRCGGHKTICHPLHCRGDQMSCLRWSPRLPLSAEDEPLSLRMSTFCIWTIPRRLSRLVLTQRIHRMSPWSRSMSDLRHHLGGINLKMHLHSMVLR